VKGYACEWFSGAPATPAGVQRPSDERWLALTGEGELEPYVVPPTLAHDFSDLQRTEAAFRDFSNRFGLLLPHEFWNPGNGQVLNGVSLSRFVSEHDALQQVVALLEAVRGRTAPLRQHLQSINEHVVPKTASTVDLEKALKDDTYRKSQGLPRELEEICAALAAQVINTHLRGDDVGDRTITTIERGPESGDPTAVQRTQSLLGSLWLQCARVLEGDQDRRRCQSCRDWFVVSPHGAGRRQQTIYCSQRCNNRAYVARKAVAARKN